MILNLFGCCSGTEPIEKYKHVSFAFEIADEVYWFDAGEGCSNTAHLMGVDLTRVSNIFISHAHIDHIGGLFNLLWFMYKLSGWYKKPLPNDGKIGLFIPDVDVWDGILQMLVHTREGCPWDSDVIVTKTKSGLLFKDKNIEVWAYHNLHLSEYENGDELSFSFKIKAEGKTVIYSGDVKTIDELDSLFDEPCDYLIMETGHHKIKDVCEYVNKKPVENVICIHHGREAVYNVQQARLLAQEYSSKVFFGEDGERITL